MSSPLRFLVMAFLRSAALLALTLAVFSTVGPAVFEGHPWKRIFFICSWALLMSLWQLWKARRRDASGTFAGRHFSDPTT